MALAQQIKSNMCAFLFGLLIFSGLLLASSTVSALELEREYVFRTITSNDGLVQNTINALQSECCLRNLLAQAIANVDTRSRN